MATKIFRHRAFKTFNFQPISLYTTMASSDSLSNSSSLADWFDGFSHIIFFQPDDALAAKTFEERVSDDAVIR